MSFPDEGVGLGALRGTRQSFANFERGAPLLPPPSAARERSDTMISMQPVAAPVAQQRAALTADAQATLLSELQEIEQKKDSCASYLCVIPAALFAFLGALAGCVIDVCCEGLSEGWLSTKSCAKKGFACWSPSKEELKRQHIQQARSTYVISRAQENDLIQRSTSTTA